MRYALSQSCRPARPDYTPTGLQNWETVQPALLISSWYLTFHTFQCRHQYNIFLGHLVSDHTEAVMSTGTAYILTILSQKEYCVIVCHDSLELGELSDCICSRDAGTALLLILLPPIPLRLYTLPYWSNPPFLILDIRTLWRSILSARVSECLKSKMVG